MTSQNNPTTIAQQSGFSPEGEPKDGLSPSTQRRYTRIQTRLAAAFAGLAAVITVIVAVLFFLQARNNLYTQFHNRVLSLASLAKLQQSPNLLSDIKAVSDQEGSIYKFLQQQLGRIADSDPNLISAYIIRKDQIGTIYYVVEALSSQLSETHANARFGDILNDPSPLLLDTDFNAITNPVVETTYHTDEMGNYLSAYAPVYKDDGTLVGILGLDMSADAVTTAERNMLFTTLIILVIALPLFAGAGWLLGSRLARPIVELTAGAKKIAAGDLDYRVSIKSGDEIEVLADTFNTMTARLNELVTNLEQRVAERTQVLATQAAELEETGRKSEKRASQLAAVAAVARAITTMRDVNRLLPEVTQTISTQFGYYHVGIFLNDLNNQYTELRAANSAGGAQMLAQGHRLKIGQLGIVGYVAGKGEPRIALDTGEDKTFFNNPNLPDTRSEMALPLIVNEKVIGVLDVQSTQPGAFSQEDEETLSVLADQVSIAIENASLFDEAQEAIRRYVESSWQYFIGQASQLGYQYSNNVTQTLLKPVERPEIKAVLATGEIATNDTLDTRMDVPTFAIPIKIRGETIGVVDIRSLNPDRAWDKTDVSTVQTITDRLAVALENTRLVEESLKRVARERAISEMSSKIGSSMDVSSILQQTVQELGKLIVNSEVVIQLSNESSQQVKE
jgi:GAF domain-containing protein/HAMP domain-containing protein